MDVAVLRRKRSRLTLESEEEDEQTEAAPSKTPFRALLKRTKTDSDLDDIGIVAPEDAWTVDVSALLASPTRVRSEGSCLRPHSNTARFQLGTSIIVLCVQGFLHLHYDLLCSILPDLYALAPSLQALVLCRDSTTHIPSKTAEISLPLVQAVGPSYNHFVRLGLLHPLGGGDFPLDALVVVDAHGRRRLVLPFGWGAGRHASSPAGRTVQDRLMKMLRSCVEMLVEE